MRGMGTDERMIIDVLVKHSNLQRQAIENKYKAMYGKVRRFFFEIID